MCVCVPQERDGKLKLAGKEVIKGLFLLMWAGIRETNKAGCSPSGSINIPGPKGPVRLASWEGCLAEAVNFSRLCGKSQRDTSVKIILVGFLSPAV